MVLQEFHHCDDSHESTLRLMLVLSFLVGVVVLIFFSKTMVRLWLIHVSQSCYISHPRRSVNSDFGKPF